MKYCFVCVCQAGELEIQSLLLIASLKRYVQIDYECYVAIPRPTSIWGQLTDSTLKQLQAWQVKTFYVNNDIAIDYPIANKLNCFNVPTDAEKIIFLDSDMVFLKAFVEDPLFKQPLCARTASLPLLENNQDNWQTIYKTAKLPLPTETIVATVSQALMLPYYNAGFIMVDKSLNFSKTWLQLCQLLDKNPDINGKRPFLDQIALPLAAAKLGITCTEIDKKYNYPPRLQHLNAVNDAIIYHYNNPAVILSTAPQVQQLIQKLADIYPIIKTKLFHDPNWSQLLASANAAKGSVSYPFEVIKTTRFARYRNQLQTYIKPARSNVIVTGIPRSGSSLLSTLINKIDNAVCLNEIRDDSDLFAMFQSIRQQIINTHSIENKVDANNKLTTNTIGKDTQVKNIPIDIQGHNFVLAQKFTLRYLMQLEKLIADQWQIWAIVRHPVYTLLSWMRCPDNFPITQISRPNRWFHEVAFSSEQEDMRRIDIWNHLADKLYQNQDKIHIVRYEDLVNEPQTFMNSFSKHYHLKPHQAPLDLNSKNQTSRYIDVNDARIELILKHAKLDLFGYDSP